MDSAIDEIIVGQSAPVKELKKLINVVAGSPTSVLILGETGSGKELVARAIHVASGRRGKLVSVNCAAIPAELLESELFGHEKGSFTGADERRIGLRPWTKDIVDRTLYIMGGSISALESCIEDGIAGNLAGGTHHSYFDYGSGYCIFNDLVICASYAKNNFDKIKKILIIDLDVHQGDGTASMTSGDDSVFTFSIHCSSNFPLKKMASDLDVPVSRYVTEDSYLEIFTDPPRV